MPIIPDEKNWTWVLDEKCPECAFDAAALTFRDVPSLIRLNAAAWPVRLDQDDARDRPDDSTWSPLEYAAHVRDVFRIFQDRLKLMLEQDEPTFENWDQDATAIADRYDEQESSVVAEELLKAADQLALDFEAVTDAELGRTGLRSDGSSFTVETLALYFIHDPIHHLHDVR